MYKFGQEITPVLSGTTWPVQVAQYDRYIQQRSIEIYYGHFYLTSQLI